MHTFFCGWRRTAGVVTLVMACLLMVAWFRSHIITEQVWHGSDCTRSQDVRLGSSNGAIYWIRETVWWEDNHCRKPMDHEWHWVAERPRDLGMRDRYRYSNSYWIPGAEIAATDPVQISKGGIRFAQLSYWRCSYLWLAIPLTLLSAYLVRWKPPKLKRSVQEWHPPS